MLSSNDIQCVQIHIFVLSVIQYIDCVLMHELQALNVSPYVGTSTRFFLDLLSVHFTPLLCTLSFFSLLLFFNKPIYQSSTAAHNKKNGLMLCVTVSHVKITCKSIVEKKMSTRDKRKNEE